MNYPNLLDDHFKPEQTNYNIALNGLSRSIAATLLDQLASIGQRDMASINSCLQFIIQVDTR